MGGRSKRCAKLQHGMCRESVDHVSRASYLQIAISRKDEYNTPKKLGVGGKRVRVRVARVVRSCAREHFLVFRLSVQLLLLLLPATLVESRSYFFKKKN